MMANRRTLPATRSTLLTAILLLGVVRARAGHLNIPCLDKSLGYFCFCSGSQCASIDGRYSDNMITVGGEDFYCCW